MKAEEFNEMRKDLIKKCIQLTDTKGKDYTKGNVDMLYAFKHGGESFDVAPEKYLGFGLKKHIDAIYHYIKTDGASQSEPIESRITDAINYLIFLQGLNKDKENTKE